MSEMLNEDLVSDRGGTSKSSYKESKSLSSKYQYNDYEEEDEYGDNEKDEEDVVTPYSICNQTNAKLLVKRLTAPNENEKGTN